VSLVVFRADGGPAIGAGHVLRSLALASVFRDGGWSIGFAATVDTFDSIAALRDWPLERLPLDADAAGEPEAFRRQWPDGADILVVDHYGRDASLEQACRGWARRIVVIDDLADRPHDADVVVDVAHSKSDYRKLVSSTCVTLVGAEHAIVHPAFRAARAAALAQRDGRAIDRMLVSFGQVDTANATMRALRALKSVGLGGDIDVVLGSAAPHLAEVRAAGGDRVRVYVDVPAEKMSQLMSEADFAIGAGGVTALERCCLGLPSIVATIADNQTRIVAMLRNAGAASDAGGIDIGFEGRLQRLLHDALQNKPRRLTMAKAGASLVDGRGAERIALAAIGPWPANGGRAISLRLAGADDEAWLLELQSQPETRRFANDPASPKAEAHHAWLGRALADPARLLMIAEIDGERAGMLRLDRVGSAERVSIAVDRKVHRQGVGAAILGLAARLRPHMPLEAEVLPGNEPSLALFAGAGYLRVGERLFRREPK
jgi:UDP-2,4-diacetamido-2,4,6-trideoxy-beta-L-altropyranose hydrolase